MRAALRSGVGEVGFEGVEGGVEASEVAGAAEGEGAGVGEDAAAEEKVAGLAAGGLHQVVVVGELHEAGDGVDGVDGGEGGLVFFVRLGPFEEVEAAEGEGEGVVERGGDNGRSRSFPFTAFRVRVTIFLRREFEAVLVVGGEDAGEKFGGGAEGVEGAAPEFEGGGDGDDEGGCGLPIIS